MYEYRGRVVRVIDADTLLLTLDLGFSLTITDHFRLVGLNAPELATQEGKAAATWVANWLKSSVAVSFDVDPFPLIVRTQKDKREKFGRLLATIDYRGANLNAELIAAGHAKPAKY